MIDRRVVDHARHLVAIGIPIVRIPPVNGQPTKGPRGAGWQSKSASPDEFTEQDNLGIILGDLSGLVDVDLDCAEAVALAPRFLPATNLVHGRPSNPSSHYWYRCTGATKQLHDPTRAKNATIVELRGTGGQTMVPPSVHPEGELVRWERTDQPAPVAYHDLLRAVRQLAAASLLARHWSGSRHFASMALCGALARAGWTEDAITAFVTAIASRVNGDDGEPRKRAGHARDSIAKVATGGMVTGLPKLIELGVPDKVIGKVREWLELKDPAENVIAAVMSALPSTGASLLGLTPAEPAAEQPAEQSGNEYGSDLRSYLGTDDPGEDPDAWLIYSVMPAGVPVVIGGHPKSWKTFLAEHMAICLAAGVDWQGRKVKRCRVLILPREDSLRETRKRIWRIARGLGIDPRDLEGWLRIDSKTPFYFADKDDVARMRRTIESWRPDLILIDSLSRTHTGDENSKKEMSIVTSTWGDLCQEYELTLATIHHFTKTGEGSLLQKLRGSGDIGALVRHIIGVEKHPDGTLELSFEGNLHPLPDPFLLRLVDAVDGHGNKAIRFEDAGSALASHFQRIDRAIIDYVGNSDVSGVTGKQIEQDVTGKSDVIRARVKALRESGKILHLGKRYQPALPAREVPADILVGARLITEDKS